MCFVKFGGFASALPEVDDNEILNQPGSETETETFAFYHRPDRLRNPGSVRVVKQPKFVDASQNNFFHNSFVGIKISGLDLNLALGVSERLIHFIPASLSFQIL